MKRPVSPLQQLVYRTLGWSRILLIWGVCKAVSVVKRTFGDE